MNEINEQEMQAEEMQKQVAIKALATMTNKLVKMESEGKSDTQMMEECVWPILHEASKTFDEIKMGSYKIP